MTAPVQKIGLALGGGGARGLAHIGVLKVFEEAHISIGWLTGSSIGGVIAAAYAAGRSPAQLEAVALRYAHPTQLMRMMDPSRLQRGILQGRSVRRLLVELIGDEISFADLRIPLALTAVDLPRGQLVVLQEGCVVDAVMATSAVPGIWPPVERGDAQLVDGGLLNNIPVDITRQLGAEVVVAVSVAPLFPRQAPLVFNVPFLPVFGDLFYQSILILSDALTRHQIEHHRPEILLCPEIPDDVWLMGFDRAAETIAAGEKAARAQLAAIQALVQPPAAPSPG